MKAKPEINMSTYVPPKVTAATPAADAVPTAPSAQALPAFGTGSMRWALAVRDSSKWVFDIEVSLWSRWRRGSLHGMIQLM